MMLNKGNPADALSLRTLDSTNMSPTDEHFTSYHDDHEQAGSVAAKMEPPQAPSTSSYLSSPPLSHSDWTPDSSSEFSNETSRLLGSETPPPQYESPSSSTRGRLPQIVPPAHEQWQTVSDEIPGKAKRACRCERSQKRARIVHVIVALLIIKAFIFFMIFSNKVSGFLWWRKSRCLKLD
jgi:hypothetical protein